MLMSSLTDAINFCYRKKLYQDVFEYDYPLLHPEPRIFKFLHPQVYCDYDNPWKESFRQLVSIILYL